MVFVVLLLVCSLCFTVTHANWAQIGGTPQKTNVNLEVAFFSQQGSVVLPGSQVTGTQCYTISNTPNQIAVDASGRVFVVCAGYLYVYVYNYLQITNQRAQYVFTDQTGGVYATTLSYISNYKYTIRINSLSSNFMVLWTHAFDSDQYYFYPGFIKAVSSGYGATGNMIIYARTIQSSKTTKIVGLQNGNIKWSFPADNDPIQYEILNDAVFSPDEACVYSHMRTQNGFITRLVALDALTGTFLWAWDYEYQETTATSTQTSVASNGKIFAWMFSYVFEHGWLYVFNSDGLMERRMPTLNSFDEGSIPFALFPDRLLLIQKQTQSQACLASYQLENLATPEQILTTTCFSTEGINPFFAIYGARGSFVLANNNASQLNPVFRAFSISNELLWQTNATSKISYNWRAFAIVGNDAIGYIDQQYHFASIPSPPGTGTVWQTWWLAWVIPVGLLLWSFIVCCSSCNDESSLAMAFEALVIVVGFAARLLLIFSSSSEYELLFWALFFSSCAQLMIESMIKYPKVIACISVNLSRVGFLLAFTIYKIPAFDIQLTLYILLSTEAMVATIIQIVASFNEDFDDDLDEDFSCVGIFFEMALCLILVSASNTVAMFLPFLRSQSPFQKEWFSILLLVNVGVSTFLIRSVVEISKQLATSSDLSIGRFMSKFVLPGTIFGIAYLACWLFSWALSVIDIVFAAFELTVYSTLPHFDFAFCLYLIVSHGVSIVLVIYGIYRQCDDSAREKYRSIN